MKKLTDKDIQELLESQMQYSSTTDSEDLKTYQIIFEALEQRPEGSLPLGFADKVAMKAVEKSVQRKVKRYWLMVGMSVFFTLCICAVSLFIYPFPATLKVFSWMYEGRWIVLFGVLMFGMIQFADYWLMRKNKLSTHS